MKRGRLLAFEGLDGCGKSTQIARLARVLESAGRDPVVTREPTEGRWGRRIRAMARSGEPVPPEEELRWFLEDRREHVAEVLDPALQAGRVVLTDRYYLSTVAYQGARGLDWRRILADSEAEFPAPDLALLLDVDPEVGLRRVRARGAPLETVFEDRARLDRVAEIFRSIRRPYLERVAADAAPDSVHAEVCSRLSERLGIP